jgi:hypothetical protein
MTFFSPKVVMNAMQMVTPGQFALLEPLVYADYFPLAVYQFSEGSGHNFQSGKQIIGYIFIGRGNNKHAIRYFAWAGQMTRRLFQTGCHPVLSAAFARGGPAYSYRVCLLAQFYGGQHQLR